MAKERESLEKINANFQCIFEKIPQKSVFLAKIIAKCGYIFMKGEFMKGNFVKPKIVVMVTNDVYELPIATGTIREIAEGYNLRINTVHNAYSRKGSVRYRAFGKWQWARIKLLTEAERKENENGTNGHSCFNE